jgi:acetyl esterase/lipase
MLCWTLLALIFFLLALGALTTWRSPAWSPWKWAVLAGEYGHWLAVLALIVVALAGYGPGSGWFKIGVGGLGVTAAGFLLKPAWQASRLAVGLPEKLAASFGPVELGRPAFSLGDLWWGRGVEPVVMTTWEVAPGLPVDFYRAIRTDGQPAPCVMVIHGGGWDSGDRRQIVHFNHWLARRGYAVAAISYRLAPTFPWPAQREDGLAAMAWLRARAGELGIDAANVVLLGRSAGGQIAQCIGYTAGDPAIRGVVGCYAPSDLIFGYVNTHENDMLKSPALMRQFLGGTPVTARANYVAASAWFHVTPRVPPTLLLHGTLDALAWYRHSVRLAARLAAEEVPHALVLLPWATHAFDFNLNGPGGQLTRFSLEWFLASVTR